MSHRSAFDILRTRIIAPPYLVRIMFAMRGRSSSTLWTTGSFLVQRTRGPHGILERVGHDIAGQPCIEPSVSASQLQSWSSVRWLAKLGSLAIYFMRLIALLALIFGVMAQVLLTTQDTAGFGIGCGVIAVVCSLFTVYFAGGGEEGSSDRFWGIIMSVIGVLLVVYCVFHLPAGSPNTRRGDCEAPNKTL